MNCQQSNELKDEISLGNGLGASDWDATICVGHWPLVALMRPSQCPCSTTSPHLCIWFLDLIHLPPESYNLLPSFSLLP